MQWERNDIDSRMSIPTEYISQAQSHHAGRGPTRCPRKPCEAVKFYRYYGECTSLQLHNTSRFKISMNFAIFCIDTLFTVNLRTRGGHHNELWLKIPGNVNSASRFAFSIYFFYPLHSIFLVMLFAVLRPAPHQLLTNRTRGPYWRIIFPNAARTN